MFTLEDFEKLADFFFSVPKLSQIPMVEIEEKEIGLAANSFERLDPWNAEKIKEEFQNVAEAQKIDRVKIISAIRNIISGKTITPPLYESMEIIGKDETIRRIRKYLE